MVNLHIGKSYQFPDGEIIKVIAGIHTLRYGYCLIIESSRHGELMPYNPVTDEPVIEVSDDVWLKTWQHDNAVMNNGESLN